MNAVNRRFAMAKDVILVVEDEEDILELVRFSLDREGYQVLRADSAERALEILGRQPVDLIVLDLMLPAMDGLTLARRLKSHPKYHFTPIVMLTAKTGESDIVAGLEVGAADYITKPFSPRVLVA